MTVGIRVGVGSAATLARKRASTVASMSAVGVGVEVGDGGTVGEGLGSGIGMEVGSGWVQAMPITRRRITITISLIAFP